MQSLPLISTEKIKPELAAEPKLLWALQGYRPMLRHRMVKARSPDMKRLAKVLDDPTMQTRIRRNLYRSLPWPLDRKKPKRKD